MTGNQYKAALKRLDISIVGAGRYFGLSRRHSQKLAAGEYEVPDLVRVVVRLLLDGIITKEELLCQIERKS